MDVNFSQATISDIEYLTNKTVELQTYESKGQSFQETLSQQFHDLIKHWLTQELSSSNALLFLIHSKKELLGFAHIRISSVPNEFTDDKIMGEVQSLFIEKKSRSKGVGKTAVEFIEKLFAEFNVDFYEVHYVSSNQSAEHFWRDCGLTVHSVSARKRLKAKEN
ncbi:MAG: GNAT family N-acetyltransferase [Gammaproteobacteria bacterium]|nr:GNAT family N-acetyltransferase [Gammaproteobacteria bacterium]